MPVKIKIANAKHLIKELEFDVKLLEHRKVRDWT